MSNSGFIPFSRKIFDHKFWQESRDYSKFEAWVDLIQLARYDSAIQQIHTYGVCELGRGQLVASIRFLSKRWGWSEKRVRNFMEHLEREKMIEKELHNGKKEGTTTEKNGNEKGTQKGTGITIVTICNYDHYNSLEDKRGTVKGKERAQQGHSRGTRIKKDNKGNKDNKDNTTPIPPIGGDDDAAGEWRLDYQTYLTQLREAYKQAKADAKWVAQRENYHKNLDVLLTIEKSCTDYWATEEGWNKKLNSKTKNINWKSTFNTALTVKSNQVYKPRNNPQSNENQVF